MIGNLEEDTLYKVSYRDVIAAHARAEIGKLLSGCSGRGSYRTVIKILDSTDWRFTAGGEKFMTRFRRVVRNHGLSVSKVRMNSIASIVANNRVDGDYEFTVSRSDMDVWSDAWTKAFNKNEGTGSRICFAPDGGKHYMYQKMRESDDFFAVKVYRDGEPFGRCWGYDPERKKFVSLFNAYSTGFSLRISQMASMVAGVAGTPAVRGSVIGSSVDVNSGSVYHVWKEQPERPPNKDIPINVAFKPGTQCQACDARRGITRERMGGAILCAYCRDAMAPGCVKCGRRVPAHLIDDDTHRCALCFPEFSLERTAAHSLRLDIPEQLWKVDYPLSGRTVEENPRTLKVIECAGGYEIEVFPGSRTARAVSLDDDRQSTVAITMTGNMVNYRNLSVYVDCTCNECADTGRRMAEMILNEE